MSSWFNFYRKIKYTSKKDEDGLLKRYFEYAFDGKRYQEDIEILNYLEENKGKFIPVINDLDDSPLSEEELKKIEEAQERMFIPIYIETDKTEIDPVSLQPKHKSTRKSIGRKRRLPISTELRKTILTENDRICEKCGEINANQLHHRNNNPADNRRANLILLCYNCHLKHHINIKINEI